MSYDYKRRLKRNKRASDCKRSSEYRDVFVDDGLNEKKERRKKLCLEVLVYAHV